MDNKIKIYVADSTEFKDEFVNNISKVQDVEVVGASADGIVAFDEVCKLKPDILLMDIVLPGQDGFVLIEKLKLQLGEFCPKIVVVSALIHEGFISKALSMGVSYYINKPSTADNVLQRIKDVYN